MPDLRYTDWQGPYQEALTETSQEKVFGRVYMAETAILSRMTEIQITSETRLEAEALDDALRALSILRKDSKKSGRSQRAISSPSQLPIQAD